MQEFRICIFYLLLPVMNHQGKDMIKQMNELGKQGTPFFFIIDFALKKPRILLPDELQQENVEIEMPGLVIKGRDPLKIPEFYFKKFPIDYSQYKNAFEKVRRAIHRGDTFLLNLTFPTRIETNLSLNEIFRLSKAKYKLRYKDEFVVFSPEPFVKTKEGIISTFPMKGTIDASIGDAAKMLMDDPKEIAEHNTIVDLLRNDLNIIASHVKVERFRYLEKIKTHDKTILQTSSKISGELPGNWQQEIGDIIFRILPAGSISGAPKRKTVELITEAEISDRGYFTGVFGYFDGSDLNSAVMIRYIERSGDELFYRSGGGITSFSQCEKEYRELIDKVYVPIVRDHQD